MMTENGFSPIDVQLTEAIAKLNDLQKEEVISFVNSLLEDRRFCQRKNYHTQVDYANSNRSAKGFIQNISATGVYIEPDGPFANGQEITLTFEHPTGNKPVKITGKIARKDHKGMGVRFTKIIGCI